MISKNWNLISQTFPPLSTVEINISFNLITVQIFWKVKYAKVLKKMSTKRNPASIPRNDVIPI